MSNAIKGAPRKRVRRWNEREAAEALPECAKSGLPIAPKLHAGDDRGS